jgi:hypothetical protein
MKSKANFTKRAFDILDEEGNVVDNNYLMELLKISKTKEDFVNKVNEGITIEDSYVSISNNMRIQAFYNSYK